MPAPERAIITRIRKLVAKRLGKDVVQGIGDDCAVLRPKPGHELLVTTDFSLEGTHFRREWHPAESVGHRCLARGLSDIAAMGGEPTASFLSLGLPAKLPQKWVDDFLAGFLHLAERYNCPLTGGDIAESRSGVLADVMVVGSIRRGKAILRSGAKAGDVVYVTGSLGASAAVLDRLYSRKRSAKLSLKTKKPQLEAVRHFFPEPRLAVAQFLSKQGLASAMIDLSDGLSTDLAHICEESGVGATLVEHLVPIAKNANLELALHGGEDYELLFTAKPNRRIQVEICGIPIHEIGWITKEKGLQITDLKKARRLQVKGWEHFRG